jgi:hypothetical protein
MHPRSMAIPIEAERKFLVMDCTTSRRSAEPPLQYPSATSTPFFTSNREYMSGEVPA